MKRPSLRANSARQIVAQGFGLGLSLLTAPYFFAVLGPESHGLLLLVNLTNNYLSFLDLGLGQASVRAIAEADAHQDREKVVAIVGTGALTGLVLGLLGAGLVMMSAPVLTGRVLTVPSALLRDARHAFVPGAFCLLVGLQVGLASAPLRAYERLDLVSRVSLWTAIAQAAANVLALRLGGSVDSVLWSTCAVQLVTILVYWKLNSLVLGLGRLSFDRDVLNGLMRFGGYATVSQLVAALLVHGEKMVVGSVLGVGQVPYYAVPFSLAFALAMIPSALGAALFPRLARLSAAAEVEPIARLLARSSRHILAAVVPPAVFLAGFAPEILDLWMGPGFGTQGSLSLRILAFALVVNAAAASSFYFLQASGRPEIPARLHVAELLFHLPLCVWLVGRLGITGAGLAWLIRVLVDTVAMLWATQRALGRAHTLGTVSLVWRPFLASSLLLLPILSLQPWLAGADRGFGLLALLVALVVHLFASLALGLNQEDWHLLIGVVREIVWPRSEGGSGPLTPLV